jgi:hypothetical protein
MVLNLTILTQKKHGYVGAIYLAAVKSLAFHKRNNDSKDNTITHGLDPISTLY